LHAAVQSHKTERVRRHFFAHKLKISIFSNTKTDACKYKWQEVTMPGNINTTAAKPFEENRWNFYGSEKNL
jgi:hypothetical protein